MMKKFLFKIEVGRLLCGTEFLIASFATVDHLVSLLRSRAYVLDNTSVIIVGVKCKGNIKVNITNFDVVLLAMFGNYIRIVIIIRVCSHWYNV